MKGRSYMQRLPLKWLSVSHSENDAIVFSTFNEEGTCLRGYTPIIIIIIITEEEE
jgi:hypothetical protein